LLRAVIIDDEYVVVKGLKIAIDWEKYNIEIVGEAMDGNEGLRIIGDCLPDVVLTDIRMPGIDGIALIEKAKRLVPDAFFVIFSGFRDFEYAKKAISIGVVEYIEKPVTVSKMDEALNKICDLYRSRKEYLSMKRQLKKIEAETPGDTGPGTKSIANKSIAKAKDYLEENFAGDVTLEKLAEIARMNPTYFSMMFKNEVGIGYIKYLNSLRMEKAQFFLRQGLKVKEAARGVGYTNTRYFCYIFKKTYGITPEQYKKQ